MNINPDVQDCAPAPIAEAWSWVDNPDDPDLIDVCQAVPSYLPHPEMLEFLAHSMRQGHAATYTDIQGILPLRQELCGDVKERYEADMDPESIIITAGCNQGFCTVIDTLCRTGDNVIVPLPCYFNHEMWLSIRGVTPRWLEFNDATAVPDPNKVDSLVDDNTRAIVLVSPNNPTGAAYSDEVLNQFFEVAKKHDLCLVVDETYRDFMDTSSIPHSLFQRNDWQDTFIHLYSFSKAFSLTGFRVGAMVAGDQFIEQASKIQDCVAICAPHVGQIAAQFGLENLKAWRNQKGAEMMQRAAAIKKAFDEPGLNYELVSAGAYFAYIKHPFDASSRAVAERLAREFKVVCLPGIYFGEGQDAYLRFAFANVEESMFPELVRRLTASQ
jgi:aspartate/methionine/tyrosine aminotransferase